MTQYKGNLTYNEVTIANGGTASTVIDLQGLVLVQIIMPAALTGTSITFQSCPTSSGGTFQTLYNSSNTAMSITVAASRSYNIAPVDFAGVRFLKVVSGSAEGAQRTIGLVTREAV